jgi:hypothetical protein
MDLTYLLNFYKIYLQHNKSIPYFLNCFHFHGNVRGRPVHASTLHYLNKVRLWIFALETYGDMFVFNTQKLFEVDYIFS